MAKLDLKLSKKLMKRLIVMRESKTSKNLREKNKF